MVKEECKADNITNDLIKNYASKFEEYDTNKDGEYSEEELSKVEELYIDYGDDITKVRGISDLKNLKDLELEGNGNPNLEELKELKNLKKIELTFRKASSGKFNTNIKAKYMYIYCNKEVKALNLSNIKNIPKVEMEAPGLKK